jgi:hypothetical protein
VLELVVAAIAQQQCRAIVREYARRNGASLGQSPSEAENPKEE